MKLNMDRRRFLIRGIDDYERALDAISLDSHESDESSVVDSETDVADDLDDCAVTRCFGQQNFRYVLLRRCKHR